jgi:hypothetical protein
MAITKIQSESLNLSDTYDFTGTVTGAGGDNKPAFQAKLSSNQNISSGAHTKVQFDTELFDTDNTYDNSTNYRFTPGVAGKYVLTASVRVQNCGNATLYFVDIYKNGSSLKSFITLPGRSDDLNGMITAIDVANTTDYYEIYARQGSGSTQPLLPTNTYFNAYKIIE